MKRKYLASATTISLVITLLTACHKEAVREEPAVNNPVANPAPVTSNARAIYGDRTINWENRTNMTTYTFAQAEEDFGNVSGWVDSRGYISNGNGGGKSARITLLPNALSGDGGVIANIDIADGAAYEIDYDIKFHSQFNWGKGGKVGFGFKVGEGNTGGDPGTDGNGESLRLMWYASSASRVFFQPYVYYKDQPGQYGNTFGRSYPSSGSLEKGRWYRVHMYIKSNTGSSTNGHVQIIIDGTTVLDQAIRWTTNDNQRLIKHLTFHTFRGGSTSDWMVSSTDYIYYDNLRINKI